MTIIRNKRFSNFTTIPNDLINDHKLYWQDLGLVLYLLSKPDTWTVRPDVLAKERNLGRDGVYEILKRLREAGYAELIRYPSGKTEWTIYDQPNPEKADKVNKPHPENPDRENPDRENPDVLVNTDKAVNTDKSVNTDSSPQTVIHKRRKEDWQKPESIPSKKQESPKKQKNQLSEFPEVFEVTEEMVEFAVALGLSYDAIRDSTSRFKDHHISKGNKFKDWKAAWRNWMRKTVEYKVGVAR